MIRERTGALHVLLTVTDHATCAITQQMLTRRHDYSSEKVATAVFSMFTKKINYLHLCGSTLMQFRML